MSIHLPRRTLVASTLAAGVLLALTQSPAAGHVGTDRSAIVAGESTTVTFAIGHGCEDSPTNSMKFQIPESVVNAAPQVKPGWSITTESDDLATPIESAHGDPQTERVSVITFTAEDGNAVDPHFRDTFTLAFRAPEELGVLPFKVIQGCEVGENAWIEEWDGTGEEPESPAPSVAVIAADSDAEGGDATATTVPATGATESTVAVTSSPTTAVQVTSQDDNADGDEDEDEDEDDGDSSQGLAVTGIVIGGLGLVTGGAALARGRRPVG